MRYCPLCERTYGDEVTVCTVDGSILRESGAKQDPLIGKLIRSRYRVLKKLGEGGMGSVYLAEQIAINRNVALKILHPDYARDPEFVKRFRQEAKLAASLSHHNIVTIFDFDQADDGSLYIVMEYVAGHSLSTVIKSGLLDVRMAVRLGIQIAEGLRAAHAAGVIHRDIKPENIMVLPGDEIKLMDFGIARLSNVEGITRLTRSGMIMGTPTYMAPEQIEGGEVGVATDIYAFGVLLYEMLSGHVPFTAPTPGAVLIKHLTETAAPLRKLRNDIPAALEKVVKQALEKKPERRQRSMGEVVELLAKSQRATAAERKSLFSAMGGLFKSAFTRPAEPEQLPDENTAAQQLEQPLETAFQDARPSTRKPSVVAETASPINEADVPRPVVEPPASATVDLEHVPAAVIRSGGAEIIEPTQIAPPFPTGDSGLKPLAAQVAAETVALSEPTPQATTLEPRPDPLPEPVATEGFPVTETPSQSILIDRSPDTVIEPIATEIIAVTETPSQSTLIDHNPDTVVEPIATEIIAVTETPSQFTAIDNADTLHEPVAGTAAPAPTPPLLSADASSSSLAPSHTIINSSGPVTLAETIATTATPRIRRDKTASGLYAGLGAAAVVVVIALGFLLYHRQSDEPKATPLAQNTTGSPAATAIVEPPIENVPATVEPPPPETRQEFRAEPEPAKTRKNLEAPQTEKKSAADVSAPPVPRPAAEVKATDKKSPEIRPTPTKERIEVARLAPVPQTPPAKKVEEQVKVTEKAKPTDVEKTQKPEPVKKDLEPVKKEPETKVASIDKSAIKPPDTPPPAPENRLVSLAIVSSKKDISVKERVLLTVKGKYSNGNENEIGAGVRFESSDSNVAAVNSRGEVEGRKEGKADVIARYAGVVSGVYTFYVKGNPEKEKEDQAGERLQDQRRRLLR